jgi:hypothetical protein
MRGPSPAPRGHLNHRPGQVAVEVLQQIDDRLPHVWTAKGYGTEPKKTDPEKTEPEKTEPDE